MEDFVDKHPNRPHIDWQTIRMLSRVDQVLRLQNKL